MKIFPLVLLVGVLVFSGCARSYTVTLSNGSRMTALNKPRLQGNNYVFKDADGVETSIPAFRVSEIAPDSMAGQEKSNFDFNPPR